MKNHLFVLLIILLFFSCKKEDPDNPFDPYNVTNEEDEQFKFEDSLNFAALHHFIFQPTCANSGCHDGSFEPDFRTIQSSYNTLLFQPVIKNDPQGTFTYRVVPGDVGKSQLYNRITVDIDGNSGIMPLSIDPDSDWPEHKNKYIENIKKWIEAGAPDMFGNPAENVDLKPQLGGLIAYANGSSSPLPRNSQGIIQVPAGTNNLELWFAFIDDNTPSTQLQYNKVLMSLSRDFLDHPPEQDLQISSNPFNGNGFGDQNVQYTHSITIQPFSNWSNGNRIFIRALVDDGVNGITEIPAKGATNQIKNYFSFLLLD